MLNIYMDESGTISTFFKEKNQKYFYIAFVAIFHVDSVRKKYKAFIMKHYKELKRMDVSHKMFSNTKFMELKGSSMNFPLKKEFVHTLCSNQDLAFYLCRIDNEKIPKTFFEERELAFNHIIKLMLQHLKESDTLEEKEVFLHLDNRNVSKNTQQLLEDYLQTELVVVNPLYDKILAQYYDSEDMPFIQIADVVANLCYSSLFVKDAKSLLYELIEKNYIQDIYQPY